MRKILSVLITYCSLLGYAQVKIGDNPTNVGTSSSLELESTNKALVITRVANTAAITSPVNGMIVYDISANCVKAYENGAWTNCLSNGSNIEPSTNGTAVVSSYNCSTASAGSLYSGVTPSGVTQTVTANVTSVGTYSLSCFANGVVFSASGTFTSTGPQTVVLTAIGSPVAVGTSSFTLNTTPNCSFSRTILGNPSSGGTAIVSAYACNTASTGTMTVGTAVSGVTQTITATVTTVGSYSITATANGVTFAGSGTFTAIGPQAIVLTATGTPAAAIGNPYAYTLSTTPGCAFNWSAIDASTNGTAVVSAYNCNTATAGTLYLGTPVSGVTQTITATVTTAGTYNIAIPAANGLTWAASGSFAATGAQSITLTASGTPLAVGSDTFTLNTTPNCTFTRATINQPSSNGSAIVSAYNCNTASAGTLTVGTPVSGVTQTITATVTNAGTYSITATANGVTFAATGTFASTGAQTIMLTATGTPTAATGNPYSYTLNTTPNCSFTRSAINATTNGTAVVSAYNCSGTSAGTLTVGTAASGVTQAITATVTTIGTYDIATTAVNGITWTASGTFAATGAQTITLTASGTPATTGTSSFTLPVTPSCTFTRSVGESFVNTVCATSVGSFPSTQTIGGTSVTITKTTSTDSGTVTTTSQCGLNPGGNIISTTLGQGATFKFSVPLKNVQLYSMNNDSSESEGVTVSASLSGVAVPVQLVPFGGSCLSSFAVTQSGNNASVQTTGSTSAQAGIFNISASGTYDQITVTRIGTAGGSGQGLMFCNATAVPNTSSGGAAVVSAYSCSGTSSGTLTAGTAASGVTQTVTATVTAAGTYNITIPAVNGVSWSASGTFAGTGSQTITLTASGTPATAGTSTFTLPTTPGCSFTRSVGETFTASVCATSVGSFPSTQTISGKSVTITKTTSTDGGTLTTVSQCGLNPGGNIISISTGQGATFTFSIPLKNVQLYSMNNESTESEGLTVSASLSGVAVPVQLVPFGGSCLSSFTVTQSGNNASMQNTGSTSAQAGIFNISASGAYDQITVTRIGTAGGNGQGLMFCNATAVPNTTSGGTAVVSSYSCSGTSSGTLTAGTAASGVTQTVTATVTTAGTYNITIPAVNGVSWSASGTFAGTGSQTITLTASGTPATAGTSTFTLSTTPGCSFTRSIGSAFTSSVCATGIGTFPNTVNVGASLITITKTTNTDDGSSSFVSNSCISNITGSMMRLSNIASSATYSLSVPVKNLQIVTADNEVSEGNEGLTVSATLSGVAVPIQLVPASGTCFGNFSLTQSGNSGTARVITGTTSVAGIFNISSASEYDNITVSRVSTVAGANLHMLLFCNATAVPNATSGGTAVVSAYSCTTASSGSLTAGTAASGVSQTITATVTTAGAYNITTTTGGVTFTGSGTFAGTGSQDIVLTASGIPTTIGSNTFTLNTTPGCSFTRTVATNPSSGGTAAVSAYNCSGTSAGTLTVGTAASGVTQVVTATVTTAGTYNIAIPASNGITWSATGTFAATGAQNITLTASGTPASPVLTTFMLNTTPSCSFQTPVYTTLSYTGALQSFTVPSGMASMIFEVNAAKGGGNGGNGGRVSGTAAVTAGQTLYFYVGGKPSGITATYGFAGRGGSTSIVGYAGGGLSAISTSATIGTTGLIAVAGGGGGAGSGLYLGGNGGNPGTNGTANLYLGATEYGRGATQSAVGAAGIGFDPQLIAPTAGTAFAGGNAGDVASGWTGGGGGGAGYFGGGGAASGGNSHGAGGGGSSWIKASVTGPVYSNGINTGDGYIKITFQ